MRPAELRLLYEYGYDRNLNLLDVAELLTEEQFSGPPPVGQDSIRELFFHIASAERGWRVGWQTGDRHAQLDSVDYPDIASIRALFDRNNAESLAFIDSLSEDDLDSDDFPGVALWQTMSHVIMHGIQHRSEIALLLTNLGHSPGDLDLALYVHERALSG